MGRRTNRHDLHGLSFERTVDRRRDHRRHEQVGPNGVGKTMLFRMIAGEEGPDNGQVTIDPGMTIGYFGQDVGEISGKSAGAAVAC